MEVPDEVIQRHSGVGGPPVACSRDAVQGAAAAGPFPFLAISMIGQTPASTAIGWGWFGLWNSFIIWRCWVYVREVSREADRQYDRAGKFRLAEEYHDTESSTAAAERKCRKR